MNDQDAYLSCFWRALGHDPEGVARWADMPVSEVDMQAIHFWLVNTARERVVRMRTDPDWYDVQIAGRWVAGLCQWIGGGWCSHPEWQQLPHLGSAGMGVYAERGTDLLGYFRALSERLRRVRVCCGDWQRVLGPTPTTNLGLTGVMLDPPYGDEAGRDPDLYAHDSGTVAAAVREWAVAHGDDPLLRIALCGYGSELDGSMPESWERVAWKASGGYGSQRRDGRNGNAAREVVYFSPACLRQGKTAQLRLFGAETEGQA